MIPFPPPLLLGVGLAAAAATLIGGGLAFKLGHRPALVGVACGAVTGIALFDLGPQALTLAPAGWRLAVVGAGALGYLGYFLGGRALNGMPRQDRLGHLAGTGLTVHSLLDGFGVGLAFHVSAVTGVVAATAVVAHDVIDGVNTVTLTREGGISSRAAWRWLAADAIAPMLGVAIAQAVRVGPTVLALLLAAFAGGFLQIGVAMFAGRATRGQPRGPLLATAAVGWLLIFGITMLSRCQ